MNANMQRKALAELDGFKYVKVICEPDLTGWQLSKSHDCDGTLSKGTPWAVSYIVRDKPNDDEHVRLNLVPRYLESFDAIIPLIQKHGQHSILHTAFWETATPAHLCEELLRREGKWVED